MTGFGELKTALNFRDVLKEITTKQISTLGLIYDYAIVQSVDLLGKRALVQYANTTQAKVAIGSVYPVAGQVVRVAGRTGDRYISDVLGSPYFPSATIDTLTAKTVTASTDLRILDSGTKTRSVPKAALLVGRVSGSPTSTSQVNPGTNFMASFGPIHLSDNRSYKITLAGTSSASVITSTYHLVVSLTTASVSAGATPSSPDIVLLANRRDSVAAFIHDTHIGLIDVKTGVARTAGDYYVNLSAYADAAMTITAYGGNDYQGMFVLIEDFSEYPIV